MHVEKKVAFQHNLTTVDAKLMVLNKTYKNEENGECRQNIFVSCKCPLNVVLVYKSKKKKLKMPQRKCDNMYYVLVRIKWCSASLSLVCHTYYAPPPPTSVPLIGHLRSPVTFTTVAERLAVEFVTTYLLVNGISLSRTNLLHACFLWCFVEIHYILSIITNIARKYIP